MSKKKKLVRRPWTKDDLRTLKSMAKDKKGVRRIAKALKRLPRRDERDGRKAWDIVEYAPLNYLHDVWIAQEEIESNWPVSAGRFLF